MSIAAKSYNEVAPLIQAGHLKFKAPEKPIAKPGKPPLHQIIVEDGSPSTFQGWTQKDAQNFPVCPFGISEVYGIPDPRKKTLQYSIRSQDFQAFLRLIDEANLQYLVANSQLLWSKEISREEIEKTYYTRSLKDDPFFGLAKLDKSGRAYDPTLRTHFYEGPRLQNDGKDYGCHPSVIIPVRPQSAGTVLTYKSVHPFDMAIPVVRYVGMYYVQKKWTPTFITESMVWIPNQRQANVVPNVDLSSIPVPDYVDPMQYASDENQGFKQEDGMIFDAVPVKCEG